MSPINLCPIRYISPIDLCPSLRKKKKNHGGGRSDKSKNGSEWEFNAIGRGFNGGLEKLCRDYGVNV
ncbi:MAG: TerD family protein [Synergistaceae bacterium]|nr:TerD family protein [Synergistaceae bacterium]